MSSCLIRSLEFAAIPAASTLRRTLSADMSSEKWVSQSGLKRVRSVDHLHDHDNDHDNRDSNKAFEDIWSSIQRKEEEMEEEKPRLQSSDIWSSILSQKGNDQEEGNKDSVPPPYIHPLVKRSASTLSEKSLEICTESLGSETGSDGFSLSESVPDDSDKEEMKAYAEAEEETEVVEQDHEKEVEEVRVRCAAPVMVHHAIKKVASGVATTRSFPPPLPTLANRGDGSNVQMRSHREDGRLVLEAVSVPTHACFRAERQDGRLLLTFSGVHVSGSELEPDHVDQEEEEVVDEEFDKVGDVVEDGDDEEENQESEWDKEDEEDEDEDEEEVMNNEFATREYSVVANKFLGLTRSWPRRLNKVVNTLDDDDEVDVDYMQVAGHALNPYVYSWRNKAGPDVVAVPSEVGPHYGKSAVVEVVVEAKKAGKVGEDDLIPMFLKGCNLQQQQPKKSLLMWDHRCIAA